MLHILYRKEEPVLDRVWYKQKFEVGRRPTMNIYKNFLIELTIYYTDILLFSYRLLMFAKLTFQLVYFAIKRIKQENV